MNNGYFRAIAEKSLSLDSKALQLTEGFVHNSYSLRVKEQELL